MTILSCHIKMCFLDKIGKYMNSTAQKIETSIEVQGLCLNQTNKLISEAWWKNCSIPFKLHLLTAK